MRDNNANVDGVDTLSAAQFNTSRDEVQNAVEAGGFTLDAKNGPDTDTAMLAGAMTESSQTADFYNDGGAVNAYVLTGVGSWVQPLAYRDGMAVRFIPGNTNTGATTVNVAGLGVKAVTFQNGTALTSGELTTATLSQLFFDDSNDRFYIAPWVTATGNIDASQVVSGILALARIPSLPTSQTTTGVFATARLPAATLTAKGTVEKATAAEMTAGTNDKFPDADEVKGFVEGLLLDNFMHVQDQKTSGTEGGAAVVGVNNRVLNTVVSNTISGASLSSNLITLPAGDYYMEGICTSHRINGSLPDWYNNSDSTVILEGISTFGAATESVTLPTFVSGRFSIASSKNFRIRTNAESSRSNGLGFPVQFTVDHETYSDVRIWKIV